MAFALLFKTMVRLGCVVLGWVRRYTCHVWVGWVWLSIPCHVWVG